MEQVDRTPDGESEAITKAVAEITERRAVIEQAKGVLMVIYNIDADAAFELLKWRSQQTNTKLRVLAEQLMMDFPSLQWGQDGLRSKSTTCSWRPAPAGYLTQKGWTGAASLPEFPAAETSENGHRFYHAISRVGGGRTLRRRSREKVWESVYLVAPS